MASQLRQVRVGIGDVVDAVPISKFTRCSSAALDAAWQLVGPSAQLNLNRVPIERVIAAAYLEGVNHGIVIAKEASP